MRSVTEPGKAHANAPATICFVRRHARTRALTRHRSTNRYRPTIVKATNGRTRTESGKEIAPRVCLDCVARESGAAEVTASSTPGVRILAVTTGVGPRGRCGCCWPPFVALPRVKQLNPGTARQAINVTTHKP